MAVYMKNRRDSRRTKLIELAGGGCGECGSMEDLEFNHVDPSTKSFVLSGCYLDKAWNRILEEFAKCELLCRAHHLEKTRDQYATGELVRSITAAQFVHGTARMYSEQFCKCEDCRLAKRLYREKKITYNEVIQSRRPDFGVSGTDC